MPAELLAGPPGIACVFSDGRRKRWLLDGAGEPVLVADLLAGLAGKVHPHGTVDAPGTVDAYLIGLRDIAVFMAARGVRGGASALTRAVLAEYWLQAGGMRESTTRAMLAGYDDATGALGAGVRALVDGRRFTRFASGDPLAPYDRQQWERLQDTCRRIADDAFAVHSRALEAARCGRDPQQAGWNDGNLRWLLARHGPLSTAQVAVHLGMSCTWIIRHGGTGTAFTELFPGAAVVIAYRVLFGSYCGVVPDGIADLDVGDIDWAGDATILLGYVKGRTAAESVTLPRRAVRLLEQWLAHSALMRSHAPPELAGALWLNCSPRRRAESHMPISGASAPGVPARMRHSACPSGPRSCTSAPRTSAGSAIPAAARAGHGYVLLAGPRGAGRQHRRGRRRDPGRRQPGPAVLDLSRRLSKPSCLPRISAHAADRLLMEVDDEAVAEVGESGAYGHGERGGAGPPGAVLHDRPLAKGFPGRRGHDCPRQSPAAGPRMGEHADGRHRTPCTQAGDG